MKLPRPSGRQTAWHFVNKQISMVGHTGPYMTEEWGPEASLRVHRPGRPRWGAAPNGEAWRPRPIIAGFRDYKCRQDIFGKSKRLKGTSYAIHEDYPAEIRSARGKLWGDFCKARSENRKARIVYPAKLIVDGTVVKDMFPAWNRWTLSEYQNPPPIDLDAPKFPRSGMPMEVSLAEFVRVPPFVPRAPPPARPQAGTARPPGPPPAWPPGPPPARPPGFPLNSAHLTQHEAESLAASPNLRASYQAGLPNNGNGSVETEPVFPTYPRSHLNFDSQQSQCNSISALTIKPWLGAERLLLVSDLTPRLEYE